MSTIEMSPRAVQDPAEAEPEIIRVERSALHDLLGLVSDRAAAEEKVETTRASTNARADSEYDSARKALAEKYAATKASSRKQDEQSRKAITDAAESGNAAAKAEFSKASRRIATDFDTLREQAKNSYAHAKSQTIAEFEAGNKAAAVKFAEERRPVDEASKLINARLARLAVVFERSRKFGLTEAPSEPTRQSFKLDDPVAALYDRIAKLDPSLKLLEELFIPRAMQGRRDLWLFVVLFLLLLYPCVLGADWAIGAGLALGLAGVLGYLLRTWLLKLSRTQVSRFYYPINQNLIDAESLASHCLSMAEDRLKTERERITRRRDDGLQSAKQKHAKTISTGEENRDEQLRKINQIFSRKTAEIESGRASAMADVVEEYEHRSAEIRSRNEAAAAKLDESYQGLKSQIQSRYETAWNGLESAWRGGLERVRGTLEKVGLDADAIGPRWDDPGWSDRGFPKSVPPVLRFGETRVDLGGLPKGIPLDPRLKTDIPTSFTFPALLPFPDRANLLVEAPKDGRETAIEVLRAMMLRLLTSLPPGQVRFTIIDPVGIGRNFGAFLHLADVDEALVTGQVWIDLRQIKDRLGDLAAHMEKVTQKYLRNDYATIGEYNAVAGEVAEPYRVLVVADFPANFDEDATNRLLEIVTKGTPCGVLALIAVDSDRPTPPGLDLTELRKNAVNLTWENGRIAVSDADFQHFPLDLDTLPAADSTNRLIQRAGGAARDAKRVEVSFDFIAPSDDAWWSLDSRTGIDVALGKVGATKRQNLTLGHGTSQHVLIAGRTGSGKSTLLHALITNLALSYSPDEVDLYLIDFKKGVEFKVYATYDLPHASVIAVESEREFGISVLQKLDEEMKVRGDRFRDAGVQDINGYRNTPGMPPLPRCLLIVDEFQEFFVEDDKLAQEAARLLDRLVRQGRAFGVHVLLGSQTLGGAYALARTTLGQMAVRVALQCSEGDAPLILSDQNMAAKLLTRPGEAVYNDANGQSEGNHFFQVVFLRDDRREAYLKRLRDLARDRPPVLSRTPIVFEGDAPAEIARNPSMIARIESASWPVSPRSAQAWLGDPVAIQAATSALFRRQGGNHLLIVGQDGDAALGVVVATFLSLVAQYPPAGSETVRSGASFAILDGTPEDEPRAGYLAGLAARFPHTSAVGGWGDSARILAQVAAEVERRQQADAEGPEIYLFLHDLARFRDLRKSEDFGFTRKEEASPADLLATILREGTGLGVHVIAWCDTVNNLNRAFDHQALREFGMRVLFQMSQTDSGLLLDSPAASRLGQNRALFFSEEQNRLEKFRPYGLPSDDWLDRLRDRLASREPAEVAKPTPNPE